MTEDHTQWPSMYPAEESHWQDASRSTKFYLPIILLLLIPASYLVGHIFIYFESWYSYTSGRLSYSSNNLHIWLITLPAIMIIVIGYWIISKQARNFIRTFYQPNNDENIQRLIRRKLLGIPPLPPILSTFVNYPFIVLSKPELDASHWARWFGGPANFVIYDGTAVYLERGNKFSRVIGPGISSLERNEKIKEIVDLRPQAKRIAISPWTKDGIRIKLTLQADIQVYASEDAIKDSSKLRYPFDPIAIKTAVEYSAVRLTEDGLVENSWYRGAWGAITGSINKFVAGHSLDELFLAPEIENKMSSPHKKEEPVIESIEQILSSKISKQVEDEIKSDLLNSGIKLLDLQIIDVKIPKQVQNIREEYWESIKNKIAAKRDSRAEANRIRNREKAHAEAQRAMLKAIINRLREDSNDPQKLTEDLALSLSGILDQGIDDPILRPLIAKEAFGVLERIKKLLNDGF